MAFRAKESIFQAEKQVFTVTLRVLMVANLLMPPFPNQLRDLFQFLPEFFSLGLEFFNILNERESLHDSCIYGFEHNLQRSQFRDNGLSFRFQAINFLLVFAHLLSQMFHFRQAMFDHVFVFRFGLRGGLVQSHFRHCFLTSINSISFPAHPMQLKITILTANHVVVLVSVPPSA